MNNTENVPIKDKYVLTIKEACEYFNIGEKRMRQILRENTTADFVLMNGNKYLIKRKQFEGLIDTIVSI